MGPWTRPSAQAADPSLLCAPAGPPEGFSGALNPALLRSGLRLGLCPAAWPPFLRLSHPVNNRHVNSARVVRLRF